MKYRCQLTADYVRSILDCDYATGVLRWKYRSDIPRRLNKRHVGKIAGSGKKYIRVKIDGVQYFAHQLVWLHRYGKLPDTQIYHHNLVGSDNSVRNLRKATHSQNQLNRRKPRSNTSGIKNLCFDNERGQWLAHLKVNKKTVLRRRFKDFDAAVAVLTEARKQFHGDFVREH